MAPRARRDRRAPGVSRTPLAPERTVVADRLHSAAIHLLRRLRKQDEATGVTAARLSALSVLVFGGPQTLGALAAAEQVRPPTMTRIVAGLVREGLARRETDADDRRVTRVRPTAKGVRVLERGRRRRIRYLAERLEHLGAGDLKTLHQAAETLERVLRGPAEAARRGDESTTGGERGRRAAWRRGAGATLRPAPESSVPLRR